MQTAVISASSDEIEDLYDGLVRHRLIIPGGVDGAFGRGPVFEKVLEAFNHVVSRLAEDDGAEICTFPPVIDRRIIERVKYMDSFPDLCGAVCSFMGKEAQARELSARIHAGEAWGDALEMTQVVLNPAACYPLYPTLTGTIPEGGRLVTMLNWVFRHEPSREPTRMQSFRVREFVRVGEMDEVIAWRDMWLARGVEVLTSLGLDATPDVASDPFFGRGGKMMAVNQKEQKLKYEVLVPVNSVENPTAVCSFNFHQQHFGSTFAILTPDGDAAYTACLGFGLERVVMALFKAHGFDVERWPTAVRNRLWP
ncbi:MAG: amino acid--[acyl-carrier-protein] ligase [Pseudomonadota bacterium]|nr:amino acid--[acyl-carrier-protein] ligase [Pseudomonadota bacterium]